MTAPTTLLPTVSLAGVVTEVETRTSFRRRPWAVVTLLTDTGPRRLDVLPEQHTTYGHLLQVGATVTVQALASTDTPRATAIAWTITPCVPADAAKAGTDGGSQ